MAVKYRPDGGEVSAGCRADMLVGSCRPTRDRVSADISADCRSIYRPSVGRHIGR